MLTRIDSNKAEKLLTKSVFEQGIHVSKECIDFFVNAPLERAKSKPLLLWYDRNDPFKAHILFSKTGKRELVHIVWNKEFKETLQNVDPHYYQLCKNGLDPEFKLYMRFSRRNHSDSFDISFFKTETGTTTEMNGEDAKERTVRRMVKTALDTVAGANGQQVLRTAKNKKFQFESSHVFEKYILGLVDAQNGLCAITGLAFEFDDQADDQELLCSLDRIDSDGHYEPGNLQVVCRFVNRWKSDGNDAEFRRLMSLVRNSRTKI